MGEKAERKAARAGGVEVREVIEQRVVTEIDHGETPRR